MAHDYSMIFTLLGCTFTIIAAMIALFLWVRSEANNDRRETRSIQHEDRKDLLQICRNIDSRLTQIEKKIG